MKKKNLLLYVYVAQKTSHKEVSHWSCAAIETEGTKKLNVHAKLLFCLITYSFFEFPEVLPRWFYKLLSTSICCDSFLGMVLYDNDFETKENKIETKNKFEPQHIYR